MSLQAVLLPVFAHVLLVFLLLFRMAFVRVGALRTGEVKANDVTLNKPNWPARAMQASNCFNNQFEIPMLFYALVAIALPLRQADLLFVLLAWVFVITRYVHAGIFLTTNNLGSRANAFFAGPMVLLIMWIAFALKILLAL
jgi:hypothetical protein